MYRTELWHPLLVHLPIATLLLSSVAGLLQFIVKDYDWKKFAFRFTVSMLGIGVLAGWVGIYTGELAYNIEVRKLCDPKILQQHQTWSYASLFIYTGALLFLIAGMYYEKLAEKINILLIIFHLSGLTCLMYAGHLGASVVYEQGAAVYKPKEDCSDYIKN